MNDIWTKCYNLMEVKNNEKYYNPLWKPTLLYLSYNNLQDVMPDSSVMRVCFNMPEELFKKSFWLNINNN